MARFGFKDTMLKVHIHLKNGTGSRLQFYNSRRKFSSVTAGRQGFGRESNRDGSCVQRVSSCIGSFPADKFLTLPSPASPASPLLLEGVTQALGSSSKASP